jgi:hypothetical protein
VHIEIEKPVYYEKIVEVEKPVYLEKFIDREVEVEKPGYYFIKLLIYIYFL